MANLLHAFHFSEPAWLWALLLCIPVALWLLHVHNPCMASVFQFAIVVLQGHET